MTTLQQVCNPRLCKILPVWFSSTNYIWIKLFCIIGNLCTTTTKCAPWFEVHHFTYASRKQVPGYSSTLDIHSHEHILQCSTGCSFWKSQWESLKCSHSDWYLYSVGWVEHQMGGCGVLGHAWRRTRQGRCEGDCAHRWTVQVSSCALSKVC